MIELELLLLNSVDQIMASDEVGRGSLMGQVVSGSVFWSDIDQTSKFIEKLREIGVKDSKKISDKRRQKILKELGINIEQIQPSILYSIKYQDFNFEFIICEQDAFTIDRININNATFECFTNSYYLNSVKDNNHKILWLIDGDKLPSGDFKNTVLKSIVKGDQKSALIGLAAIIAKEYRDYQVKMLSQKYPMYEWELNAGYGTEKHRNAIVKYGLSEYHRKTFCKNF